MSHIFGNVSCCVHNSKLLTQPQSTTYEKLKRNSPSKAIRHLCPSYSLPVHIIFFKYITFEYILPHTTRSVKNTQQYIEGV